VVQEVSIMFLPSKAQRAQWWGLVMEADGVDQDGYWLGFCPIHDKVRDPELASAQFNFRKGVMRCLGEPSCHGEKRSMSLTNVAIKMLEGSISGEQR
jgi:hypothetical protein